jgi:NADPH-ferrihemoprotein reductase
MLSFFFLFIPRFGEDAGNFGFASDVLDVEAISDSPEELSNERLIIIFAATYGEGDPPDNCVEFHNWLMDSVFQ